MREDEINKIMKNFNIEGIKVPGALDKKLNEKLESIKPKKKYRGIKGLIVCILISIVSYATIPSVRTFANEVLTLLLGDMGTQNASDNGYSVIPSQTLTVGDFKIKIDNIYLDELRLTFDAYLSNPKVNLSVDSNEYYSLSCTAPENMSGGTSYFNGGNKNEAKFNMLFMGKGISNIFENEKETIELNLEINKVKNEYEEQILEENEDAMIDSREEQIDTVEKINLVIDVPKEIYKNKKIYEINEKIESKEGSIEIKKIVVSPTMMYLDTKSNIEGVNAIYGLYNLSIISDSGRVYKDPLLLSGMCGEDIGEYRQSIVPSVYYDKIKKLKLKADGVIVEPELKNIELRLDDNYPKKIEYYGSEMRIKDIKYNNNKVDVYIDNIGDDVSYAGTSRLDGIDNIAQGQSGEEKNKVLIFEFDSPKKESYVFSLGLMMNYKIPFEIDIPID
ncbi:MAG: hypothetical protein RRZ84_04575 [Romboutsia sp.]